MGIFKFWREMSLFVRIMIGFVIGVALGLILGPQAAVLNFLGTILIRLFTMVVAPLVFCLLVTAAADVGDYKTLGKIGIKTMVIFLCTTFFAIIIGLVMAFAFGVGSGVTIATEGAATGNVNVPSPLDTLINIIPNNPFAALNTNNLLQIIFFALLLGFALTRLGGKGRALLEVFRSGAEVMKEIVGIVLLFTPYGVLGLMAWVVGINGAAILLPFVKTIVAVYAACLLHCIIVQGFIMVGLLGRISPVRFFKEMKEAILFIFATCSSVATIPLTLAGVKRVGVNDKVADFVVPFGAVINMDGTAIFQGVAIVFASQIFGIELSFTQLVVVVMATTLASIGTAGVPGSGLVMLSIVLTAINLPMETIGLLAGIDRILNMARVIPNIVGDAATAVVIAKTEGELRNPKEAA
jgi:Na+/H+-dicarboxylate symporter